MKLDRCDADDLTAEACRLYERFRRIFQHFELIKGIEKRASRGNDTVVFDDGDRILFRDLRR